VRIEELLGAPSLRMLKVWKPVAPLLFLCASGKALAASGNSVCTDSAFGPSI